MQRNKQAFTLIELLVVVLIIGILAAVAVPQYQKAVMKSRYATLKNLVKSIANAQEVYYLANGQYAHNFEVLDISMPAGKDEEKSRGDYYVYSWGNCTLGSSDVPWIRCVNESIEMGYQLYLKNHSHQLARGTALCLAYNSDRTSVSNKVCKLESNGRVWDSDSSFVAWY
ncbi:MAG: prepilin-type N-terminal cleavage/methylation domain-containing protein [Elusimicrobiaceae bacterium]|nr:prepilin-type N-terminal cleavage/methylation domain-containing protein [Elusimicrobiaceae bacterium]